jgi:tripartite-type tricarboxylate transporter receptor subunit TctC
MGGIDVARAKSGYRPAANDGGTVMRSAFGAALLVLATFASAAFADEYPSKPISLVVGFASGGSADVIGRTVGAELSKVLGQQIVIENKPGAGGIIAAEYVARAAPNGYTIFIGGPGPNAIAPTLYPQLPYDAVKDFAPISTVSENPNVLIINPSVKARTVAELIALAKSRPGKLTYASAGNGSSQHLAGEHFKALANVNILHVPYKGVPQGVTGVITGEVDMMFAPLANAKPLLADGKVVALGVTTPRRSPALPDVPTIAESGLPGYEQTVWNAFFAPAGTPPAVIDKLNAATRKALAVPHVRRQLEGMGVEPAASSPEELASFVKVEIAKWGKVIRDSGARAN